MQIFKIISIVSLIIFGMEKAAKAVTYEKWVANAGRIINSFETKKLNQVSDDFDCQGISFGMQQKPIANGGLTQIIIQLAPGQKSKSFALASHIAADTMPTISDQFNKILSLLEKGNLKQARLESLKLQNRESSAECADGVKGNGFKGSAKQELEAWLASDTITQAQIFLKNKDARRALEVSYCWNRIYAENKTLKFSEFVYHLDFLTNAGGLGIYGGEYYHISNLLRDHKQYSFLKSVRIERKAKNLARWLETSWVDPINKKHEIDASKNAALIRSGSLEIGYDELQLLYIRMIRAQVGSTPAQMSFFNRGFLLVNGVGWFQSGKKDLRSTYSKMGQLDQNTLASIQCK
ncbi:MAG: hypothetical protein ABJK43_00005 [Lentilitoribacter sp.]